MRGVAAFVVMVVVAAACTSTTTTSTAPAFPEAVTGVTSTAAPRAASTTMASVSARLVVEYVQEGFYTEGSATHVELLRYSDDPDAFPLVVAVVDELAPSSGAVLLDTTVSSGRYDLRFYQRPCPGSCGSLEPPTDGCATSITTGSQPRVEVTITSRPGSPCAIDVSGAATGAPELSMELTNQPPGAAGCQPPSPTTADRLPEVLGSGFGDTVMWGLLREPPPLIVGREVEMVFRLTGSGDFDIVAIHEDGTTLAPTWAPGGRPPDESNYGRPGDEWGLAFTFSKAGCWNVQVTRGADTLDVWLLVEDPPIYVRPCEEAISTGPIDDLSENYLDYLSNSLPAGPVLLGNALTVTTFDGGHGGWGPDSDGRYPAIKIPLTVAPGATVTLSIPATHQDRISLIYQPGTARGSGRYSLDEGLAATRFEGCESWFTFFNGGFIVTGPGCYPIVISTADGQEATAVLVVGVPGCD